MICSWNEPVMLIMLVFYERLNMLIDLVHKKLGAV